MTVQFYTTFSGPDANPISPGAYTQLASHSAIQQVSNNAECTALTNCAVAVTSITSPNDQYVSATVGSLWRNSAALNLLLRCQPAADSFAAAKVSAGSTSATLLWRTSPTTGTTMSGGNLTLSVAAAPGDTFEFHANGTVYTLLHTPVSTGIQYTVGSTTDSNNTAGSAGFNLTTYTNTNDVSIVALTVGNFNAIGGTPGDNLGGNLSGGFQ